MCAVAHIPAWLPAATGLKEEDQPLLQPPALATPADGVVFARIPRTQGCAANAGIQTMNQWFILAKAVLTTVPEVTAVILYSQASAVWPKPDTEGRCHVGSEDHDRHNLAVYPLTRSQPQGLQ